MSPSSGRAWVFGTFDGTSAGLQGGTSKLGAFFSLAVRPGDAGGASVVPVAPTAVLVLPLLVAMVLARKRRSVGALALRSL